MAALADKLSRLCAQLPFVLASTQQQQLLCYLEQLQRWNRAFNLTAIRDPDKMLTHHIMDSLAVAPLLQGDTIADVGTGAGLPGIPLALCFPERRFRLIDSNGKKIRFVRQMVQILGLENVAVVHGRVERCDQRVDTVISRAFATLTDMVEGCHALLGDASRVQAFKGSYPKDELLALGQRAIVEKITTICVPGLTAERHLVNLVGPFRKTVLSER